MRNAERHKVLTELRREAEENVLSRPDDKEIDQILKSSDYARLVRSMMRAVEERARNTAKETDYIYEDFEVAADVVTELAHALSPLRCSIEYIDAEDAREHYNFWRHVPDPVDKVKAGKTPQIDREGVEAAVSAYLDCSVRIEEMDGLLIDALIGTELFAIADRKYNTDLMTYFGKIRKPVSNFRLIIVGFRTFIMLLVSSCVWSSAVIFAAYVHLFGRQERLYFGILAIIALLLVANSFVLLVSLFRAARAVSALQSELRPLLDHIVRIYSHLDTAGPISMPRLRKEIDDAADNGVGWPRSIFPLLDDISKRTDRLTSPFGLK